MVVHRRKLVVAAAFALCITAPFAVRAGFSDFEQVANRTPDDDSPYKVITIACPPGKGVVGGGAGVFWTTLPAPKLISSFQIGQSWYAEAESSDGQVWSLFVHANCATVN